MGERYTLSEVAKELGIETYTINNWEKALGIKVPRNEMNKKYYSKKEIYKLKVINELKNNKFPYKAIKLVLEKINEDKEVNIEEVNIQRIIEERENIIKKSEELHKNLDDNSYKINEVQVLKTSSKNIKQVNSSKVDLNNSMDEKLEKFQDIMIKIMTTAIKNNTNIIDDAITEKISDNVSERVLKEINYIFREKEEQDEEHFKKLDESIREYQKARLEVAVTKEKHRRLFFKKKKKEKH